MKKSFIVLLAGLLLTGSYLKAQSEADMKAWQDYMTPGNMHQLLAAYNGEWTATVEMWMAPDAPPTVSNITTTNSMMMGGRYQQSNHKGAMMGMPFEGYSLTGYDNAKKLFSTVWVDNFGTGMMTMEGAWEPATKTIHFKGKMFEPLSGKDIMVREDLTLVDSNTQELTMYDTKAGKETKTMHITFKRK